jgi:hypothetical protein
MHCMQVKRGVCTYSIIFVDEDASASFTVFKCKERCMYMLYYFR